MADLLDIAPATSIENVKIGDQEVSVHALTMNQMATIVVRFPVLKTLLKGGVDDDFIPRLILGCAESVGPIIAAGCGHINAAAYEQHAATLVVPQQVKLLKAIFRVNFPNGFGSFVEDMKSLLWIESSDDEGAPQPMKTVKMRSRRLPSESPSSSDEASPPTLQ